MIISTKAELIKFLEPFTDEIKIRIEIGGLKKLIQARYDIGVHTNGEGYILIED